MRTAAINSKPRKIPPAGSYKARNIHFIDLGTQTKKTQWGPKDFFNVHLAFELLGTKEVFDDTKGPQPFTVYPFAFSNLLINRKGNKTDFCDFLESWMGKPFTEEQLKRASDEVGFLSKMFSGKPAYINIIHNPSKDGKQMYANIKSIMPWPKADFGEAPKAENPIIIFDFEDESTHGNLEKMWPWLAETIKKSPEWNKDQQNVGLPEDVRRAQAAEDDF